MPKRQLTHSSATDGTSDSHTLGAFLRLLAKSVEAKHIIEVTSAPSTATTQLHEVAKSLNARVTVIASMRKSHRTRKWFDRVEELSDVELKSTKGLPSLLQREPPDLLFLHSRTALYARCISIFAPNMTRGGLIVTERHRYIASSHIGAVHCRRRLHQLGFTSFFVGLEGGVVLSIKR